MDFQFGGVTGFSCSLGKKVLQWYGDQSLKRQSSRCMRVLPSSLEVRRLISLRGFFYGCKVAKTLFLQAGLPGTRWAVCVESYSGWMCASPSVSTVPVLLKHVRQAQVGESIIEPVAVDVINGHNRVLACDIQPGKSMEQMMNPIDPDLEVGLVAGGSSLVSSHFASLAHFPVNAPSKDTCFRIVIKQVFDKLCAGKRSGSQCRIASNYSLACWGAL